jgi:hypothetical protein
VLVARTRKAVAGAGQEAAALPDLAGAVS